MPTVIARETFPYAGITRFAGDAFDATDEDARILALAGRITNDTTETPAPDSQIDHPRPRRPYRRRDQTADAE